MSIDHPIFLKSIQHIQNYLGSTGLDSLQQQVLERLIHSSGDFDLMHLLVFSPDACQIGISALSSGSVILTDTEMAASAVKPMARRTLNSEVHCVLDWSPDSSTQEFTRTALGMKRAWIDLSRDRGRNQQAPIVLIGSAPTALDVLLEIVSQGETPPSLIIGMPVGFIGVAESKKRLEASGLNYVLLKGSRGGAGLAASVVNALMRATVI